jgi:hypothetical protein
MQVSLIKKTFPAIIVRHFYQPTSMPLFQESMTGTVTLIDVKI